MRRSATFGAAMLDRFPLVARASALGQLCADRHHCHQELTINLRHQRFEDAA